MAPYRSQARNLIDNCNVPKERIHLFAPEEDHLYLAVPIDDVPFQEAVTIGVHTVMDSQLKAIFERLRGTAEFAEADFSDVNATSSDGDNALHCVVRWGDLTAVKALIDAGIDVNKAGDLGYTPLHVACMQGNREIIMLLIDSGADMFALSEGEPPFTTARLSGHDDICELLTAYSGDVNGGFQRDVDTRSGDGE